MLKKKNKDDDDIYQEMNVTSDSGSVNIRKCLLDSFVVRARAPRAKGEIKMK